MKLASLTIYLTEYSRLMVVDKNNFVHRAEMILIGLGLNASQLQSWPAQPELNGPLKMLHQFEAYLITGVLGLQHGWHAPHF